MERQKERLLLLLAEKDSQSQTFRTRAGLLLERNPTFRTPVY